MIEVKRCCTCALLLLLFLWSCKKQSSPISNTVTTQDGAKPSPPIDQVEKGLISLRETVINTYQNQLDNIKINDLLQPLDLVKLNSQQPYRKFTEVMGNPDLLNEIVQNNDIFFYIWQSELPLIGMPRLEGGMLAAYALSLRLMILPDSLDMGNIFDQLFIYHETVHALQDAKVRNNYLTLKGGLDEYYIFFNNDHPKWFPLFEFEAFENQILLLWLLTHGDIEKIARKGELTTDWLINALKSRMPSSYTSQLAVGVLCSITNSYYQWNVDTKGIDVRFIEKLMVAYDHENKGTYFFDYSSAQFVLSD